MRPTELFNKVLSEITPSKDDKESIEREVFSLLKRINASLKGSKLKAEAVIGGSFAKQTMIKKDSYDVDIFVLFDRKYDSDEISSLLEKSLKKSRLKLKKVSGSRDYFNIPLARFKAEIVPIIKISNSSEAKNVTDVSLLHVNYIQNKIRKNKKLAGEIMLAKAFCYANNCYGAESHIKGFSGYSLELLVSYYNSFMDLLKAASKWDPDKKIVLDPANYYKKKNVFLELNEAKLQSNLVLIDPVQKDRNASAALSDEKLVHFINLSKSFIKKPSLDLFARKFIDEKSIFNNAKAKKLELYIVTAESKKEKEDISGSKLLKLFNLIKNGLERNNIQCKSQFDFDKDHAKMFFSLKKQDTILKQGPPLDLKEYVEAFKREHKKTFIKNNKICAYLSPDIAKIFKIKDKQLKEMSISGYKFRKII